MRISDSVSPYDDFLFGTVKLFNTKYYQGTEPPASYIKNTILKQPYLFERATLLRTLRQSLLEEGRTIADIRDIENSVDWDGRYALPAISHTDPLYETFIRSDEQAWEKAQLYIYDMLQVNLESPANTRKNACLDSFAAMFGWPNIDSCVRDFEANHVNALHDLKQYEMEITFSNAVSDIDANFVGMDIVKDTLRTLYKASMFSSDKLHGKDKDRYKSLHMALAADRGKGKSTIVPYIGKAMRRLGLLGTGEVVPLTLNSIAESTLGSEEAKIQAAFNEAHGGIVFVDEADTFAGYLSKSQKRSRLVQALNSLAEERRETTCLIIATYPENMDTLLDSDQGFRSRFGKRVLKFPEYTTADLVDMFELEANKMNFTVENIEGRSALWEFFSSLRKTQEREFANGRTVRDFMQTMQAVLADNVYEAYDDCYITVRDIEKAIAEHNKPQAHEKKFNPYEEINPFNVAAKALPKPEADNKVVSLPFKSAALKPGQHNGPQ